MRDVLQRGYRSADAPALAELMNLMERHAGGHPGYVADDLDRLIATVVDDLESDSTMVFTAGGQLIAAGFTTTPPASGSWVYLTGGVHPSWRGRGLGRELLGRHHARAVAIRRERAPDAEWTAVAKVPTGDREALRLFRRFGLSPVRYWFEMVAAIGEVPATPAMPIPDGLHTTAYVPSPELERALHDAHMEAFAGNWGFQRRELDDWLNVTVRAPHFRPELSLLAFDGTELAGYVLTYDHADPDRCYLGQVGIRPSWRRRGLAGALLAGALDTAGVAGRKQVTLSVDADSPTGAVGVYERVGFSTEFSAVTHAIPLTD